MVLDESDRLITKSENVVDPRRHEALQCELYQFNQVIQRIQFKRCYKTRLGCKIKSWRTGSKVTKALPPRDRCENVD